MDLRPSVQHVLEQLAASLEQLTPEQYIYPGEILSASTIGQHVRHIIEMFLCLEQGYNGGIVNYDNRKRDSQIETNRDTAIALLRRIYEGLGKKNKALVLETAYYDGSDHVSLQFDTNYYREIAYNLEHAIHHMALIKAGIREVSGIIMPESFGVASSTLKYRSTCAH